MIVRWHYYGDRIFADLPYGDPGDTMTRRHLSLKLTITLIVFAMLTGGTLQSAVDSDIVLRTQQLDNSFIVPPGSTQTLWSASDS